MRSLRLEISFVACRKSPMISRG